MGIRQILVDLCLEFSESSQLNNECAKAEMVKAKALMANGDLLAASRSRCPAREAVAIAEAYKHAANRTSEALEELVES
jgi:hypothetical protein